MKLIRKTIILLITTDIFYLYLGISVCIGVFLYNNWYEILALQKLAGFLFIAITIHEFEELKTPGGFISIAVTNLKLPILNLDTAKFILSFITIIVVLTPLFIPEAPWLTFTAIVLSFVKALAHFAVIRLNESRKFYSPGFIAALLLILPLSIYGIIFILINNFIQPIEFAYSLIYFILPLIIAQLLIILSNGIKYKELLKQIQVALFHKTI